MKKTILVIAVFCVLVGGLAAQANPFDGRWVWDGRGARSPDRGELIFYGNIVLCESSYYTNYYIGDYFIFTDRTIYIIDVPTSSSYEEWEYSLQDSILTIDFEYDGRFTFIKAPMEPGPLEGLWKTIGGDYCDEDETYYMLFTGNIMAAGDEYGGYEGFRVDYRGKAFYLYLDGYEDIYSEEKYAVWAYEYRVNGRSLTIIENDGEELRLIKIY